jgi:hypothetical protein
VANRQCCKEIEARGLKMRMCNLRLGRLDAGRNRGVNVPRLEAASLAATIQFLLNLPSAAILPELVLAPVEPPEL